MIKTVFAIYITLFSVLSARELDSESLRVLARQSGLKSTPKNYDHLRRLVDNPENTMSAKKINLGRALFFEPLLSKDKTLTCASCHKMGEGGDDNLATAVGFRGRKNPKHLNSPTVLNAATAKFLFWDGRAKSLEEQAEGPIQASFEMNLEPKELVERLKAKQIYKDTFKEVFGEKITFENVKKALAVYERTLLTRGSYDDFLDGDDTAISAEAKEGLRLFIQKGCTECHRGVALGARVMRRFPRYSDVFPFENRGGFKGKNNQYLFRVPLLRNITKTAPYYHNGAVKNLKDVIQIESKYENKEKLNSKEIDYVLKFLQTLDGKLVDYGIKG